MDVIEIHTNDRNTFRRCRRKWDLQSPVRRNLEPYPRVANVNPWLGTGIHFALQDFHGYGRFKDPVEALIAFYNVFTSSELPEGAEEAIELGVGMLEYYKVWLEVPGREQFETLWINGVPQVEVEWRLDLSDHFPNLGKKVVYHGTFDRIARDSHGGLWVEDYKTTRAMDFHRLALDSQMKAYSWAAEQVYGTQFEGALMLQMAKSLPAYPKKLKRGGFSKDRRQKTTHWLYRQALMDTYGEIPQSYVEFLNVLAMEEMPEGDRFIHLGKMHHNQHTKNQTYQYIVQEAKEMLDPHIPLYPNPTMNCSWECKDFRTICILMDEGGDWEGALQDNFKERGPRGEWESKIVWPGQKKPESLESMLNL